MKTIDVVTLKLLQLDIMDVIHNFCFENKINYSLACGSMLGAARHKGYIPWDDDIDIYLLREDYNKLLLLFPSTLNNIKIASLNRDKKWGRAYSKAYDCRTIVKDAGYPYKIGVGIDIFPIDRVPDDEVMWKKYDRKRRILQRLYEYKISLLFRNGREYWKYLFIPIVKLLLLPFSVRFMGIYLDKYSQKYNNTESSRVFECCLGKIMKNPFRRTIMNKLIEMPFEDRVYIGMAEYDEYLTQSYGDWRKLPPKEKQVTHHILHAWWKDMQ